MQANKLFSPTIGAMEKSLGLRARQHEVIVSNIVNADTPNYKAFELHIEEELGGQKSIKRPLELTKTSDSHLPIQNKNRKALRPVAVEISNQATLRGDGNTVDVDKEMGKLAENNFMYKASAQLIYKKFEGLKNVIKGGGSH
jgi:flagellar basal-body rod protein FlgB